MTAIYRYTVPETMHMELVNWSRWCWLGDWPHPLPSTRCGSAEGDFHEEWHLETDAEVEERPIPPNHRHARIVQRVYDQLPQGPKLALKAEYPGRYTSGRYEYGRDVAARRMQMSLPQYERFLEEAVKCVARGFG